ncbi:MAG: hypothetical protein AAGF26_08375 [Cyanobacteria bacterium P01_G01_bin.49]
MENAVKLRPRRVVYKFGLIWFLINSSISSIAFYLPHQVLHSDQAFDPEIRMILILIGLVLGLSQGMLVRRYFQAHFHIFKLSWWVFSMFIGFTLTFLTALASITGLIPLLSLVLSRIGTSAPPPSDFDTVLSVLVLFSKYLFVIGSVIGGGITGFLQFAIIRKHVKFAVFWIVATALSGGLNGLIYTFFWSSLLGNEANDQKYDSIVAVTSGKIGVVYGLITGVAMMVMLQKTIEHQTRS